MEGKNDSNIQQETQLLEQKGFKVAREIPLSDGTTVKVYSQAPEVQTASAKKVTFFVENGNGDLFAYRPDARGQDLNTVLLKAKEEETAPHRADQ
jgi:hypothetical protein